MQIIESGILNARDVARVAQEQAHAAGLAAAMGGANSGAASTAIASAVASAIAKTLHEFGVVAPQPTSPASKAAKQ